MKSTPLIFKQTTHCYDNESGSAPSDKKKSIFYKEINSRGGFKILKISKIFFFDISKTTLLFFSTYLIDISNISYLIYQIYQKQHCIVLGGSEL